MGKRKWDCGCVIEADPNRARPARMVELCETHRRPSIDTGAQLLKIGHLFDEAVVTLKGYIAAHKCTHGAKCETTNQAQAVLRAIQGVGEVTKE